MAIILFDNIHRKDLFPLTYTRAVADLRMGILTAKERWERLSGEPVFIQTEHYLQSLYPQPGEDVHTWIDASLIPSEELVRDILSMETGACFADDFGWIAVKRTGAAAAFDPTAERAEATKKEDVKRIRYPWELMQWNDAQLRSDFSLITRGRISQPLPGSVQVVEPGNVFVEEGAKLGFCILNAATGPIYIGKNAEIMEGCSVRGPFAMGEGSVLKMNSRVYGATTLGPACMGGGEIKNSLLMGYSNKAHDGYLGDSVVGYWCNFGAGSSNSNIKNTAGEIKMWSMGANTYLPVGRKCGVVMGDYSRVAINASINTGTVIGVGCNVFGAGLLPTIIANFRWGVTGTEYELAKALNDINNWKNLKGQSLGKEETSVLQYIFDQNHR